MSAVLALLPVAGSAAEYHASWNGSAGGNGSADRPWDLATALSTRSGLTPGDTLWLGAGTYRGGFVSDLTGSPDRPIVVRAVPGQRVTIDMRQRDERDAGSLLLRGADTIYRDLEITCSDQHRSTNLAGSWPADIHRGSVDVRGSRLSLVNCIVHDQALGVGFWADGEAGEISGCLIYNNGWQGPDRAHGHGIYAQNARGTKRIVNNVVFHQFDYGIHVYGSDKASLKGFDIERNIIFDNGCWSDSDGCEPAILVGGGSPAERIAIRDNVAVGGAIRVGYAWGATSQDVIVTGNYCDSGFVLRDFRKATVQHNIFAARSKVVVLEGAGHLIKDGLSWDENELYVSEGRWGQTAVVEGKQSQSLRFPQWQRETGCDLHSTLTRGSPQKLRVIVQPNAHESGRAHIAVLNPDRLPVVGLDLSPVLQTGQPYRIVSVRDFYGATIVAGTFDGQPVQVPMTSVAGAAPLGLARAKKLATEPAFAAFVLLPGN